MIIMKISIVEYAHLLLRSQLTKDDVVVDATAGRGLDTLFLAEITKHVYAFDIQAEAISSTQALLTNNKIDNVTLVKDSHENIPKYVSDFKGVVFNLGYLPHGDKTITTLADSTLKTVKALIELLTESKFILIVVYPNHPNGLTESVALDQYFETLDPSHFNILKVALPYQTNKPPYLFFITKK